MSFDHIDDATRNYVASTRQTCDPTQTDCDEFTFDFDSMIDVDSETDQVVAFNQMYHTSYTLEQYQKFTKYKEHYGLKTEDAFEYIQSCHSCDTQLDTFAGEYCCGGCHNFIENLEMTCFRGIDCLICNRATRCNGDDTPIDYVTCQTCGSEEDELYSYRYKSTVYCNKCAMDVCGVLITKPEQKFHVDEPTVTCDHCGFEEGSYYINYYNSNAYCNSCSYDILQGFNQVKEDDHPFNLYSQEEKISLILYARKNDLMIEEAIEYQTHCHNCGKYVENAVFDSDFHQYCNKRCYEYCEEYRYPCYREGNCRVCDFHQEENDVEPEECDLDNKYSSEELTDLRWYAQKYELTMEEAIEYKTHCHTCGKYVENARFDSPSHQYCDKECYEYCEESIYPCYREGSCRVCSVWAFQKLQDEMREKGEFIAAYSPVLTTIDSWKELCVYNQLYECIPDLIEYFDDYEL